MKRDSIIAVKKVSLCSLDNFALARVKSKDEKFPDIAPPDKFYFVHMLFLLLGLMHFIPFSFFVTANAYWMYKFRNVSADITDTDARTVLQTHFSPANSIMNTIFSPITMVVSVFFGFKILARTRVLVMIGIMSFCFILGTCFVMIDTDTWQITFFVITVLILATISCANTALSAANMAVVSRFPQRFMKLYLMGEGLGGISSALLQITSLALGTSTEASALFYFVSGSTIMTSTFAMFYLSKYNRLFTYHVNSVTEDASKEVMPLSEARTLVKRIWAPTITFVLMLLTISPVMPNISSLVVSEDYGSGSQWTDKYFVPVITFLYPDIMSFLGRVASSKIDKTFNGVLVTAIMFMRMLILIPLMYFCNAQPRHHLPVLLPHDWQYIIIIGIFSFSNGYSLNMAFLDVTRLVEKEKVEDAYLVMLACTSLTSVLFFPIGLFSVDIV